MDIFQNDVLTVKRAGVIVSSIPPFGAQVDLMSQVEASYYGGTEPYFRYTIYSHGVYAVQQEDLLVSTQQIDPKTSTYKQYRVINDPATEQFTDHVEIVADRYRGS